MKFYDLIYFLSIFVCATSKRDSKFSNQSTQAISEVINEFFTKDDIKYDTIIYGKFSSHLKEVFNGLRSTKKYKELFECQIIHVENLQDENYLIYNPALILIDSLKTAINFLKASVLYNEFPINLKFLIYIEEKNLDINRIPYSEFYFSHMGHLTQFAYFLTRINDEINFWTFDLFTKSACGEPKKIKINSFKSSWKNSLKINVKFQTFNGCEIRVATSKKGPYTYKSSDGVDIGIIADIVKIIASNANFKPKIIYYSDPESLDLKKLKPQVEFHIWMLMVIKFASVFITSTFCSSRMVFEMTPAEKFTNWEKVLLPFDYEIWKFLVITFGVAFTIVFVINRTPKFIRNLVYGEKVRDAAFNIVGTFFGIGQIQLPKGNFARILLIIFIFFCLIIRTAYQGVLFEMMTSEIRKKPPKTIDDLYDRNYTIIGVQEKWSSFLLESLISRDKKPKILVANNNINIKVRPLFSEYFTDQIHNESAKLAFFVSEHPQFKGIQLEEILVSSSTGFGTELNCFLYRLTEDTLRCLIPVGIPQYIHKYYMDKFYPNKPAEKSEPQKLTIEDLSYGFVIWSIASGITLITFFGEFFIKHFLTKILNCLKREFRKLIGLFAAFKSIWNFLKRINV